MAYLLCSSGEAPESAGLFVSALQELLVSKIKIDPRKSTLKRIFVFIPEFPFVIRKERDKLATSRAGRTFQTAALGY